MRANVICHLTFFFCFTQINAQNVSTTDSLKTIQIIYGKSLRHKTIDSLTELQTMAGDAVIQQGKTLFSCDSVTLNKKTNVIEAFGNVRINQGDSIQTYSQYLKYLGYQQQAYLSKNVRLVDKKGSLFTQALDYNLKTGIGKYNSGGKVINNKTIITSKEGVYYADTKDVYFFNDVRVTDPQSNIIADTLLYNLQTEAANFTGPTKVKNKSAVIYTTKGTYDMKSNTGFFSNRSIIIDSSHRTYVADNIAFDKISGNVQMEGNAVINDSLDGFITTGNLILLNNQNNSFIATRKPVLIVLQSKDTTYISGDTLFSAYTTRKSAQSKNVTSKKKTDSIHNQSEDSLLIKKLLSPPDSIRIEDGKTDRNIKIKDSSNSLSKVDSVRFFIAFHHVRIFNDSLQSISDSLYYSTADSVFKLFQKPIIWTGETQITGDTMLLFTKNKKPDRIYVFNNGMLINKSKGSFYNQMAGKTLNGYFINGEINFMRVKGSPAESIYYIQDKDSAYVGMNRATGEVIDLLFTKSGIQKVKFLNDVHGILHPIRLLNEETKFLKNFNWQIKRRPANKLELFE